MLSNEVRAVVDEVHELQDAKAASDKAWDTMQAQIAAMQQQIATADMKPEDRDALVAASADMHTLAQSLQRAVPANTDIETPLLAPAAEAQQSEQQPADASANPTADPKPKTGA